MRLIGTVWSKLKISDLPSEKMQVVADVCGIDTAILLLKNLPGIQLYVPSYPRKKMHEEYILENYTGKNILSIAVKLGINTERVKYLATKKKSFKRPLLSNFYCRLIADKCGYETAVSLCKNFPGDHIYVPMNGLIVLKKRLIEREFNGSNTALLALKYQVSDRFVDHIISIYYNKKTHVEQTDLFKNTG